MKAPRIVYAVRSSGKRADDAPLWLADTCVFGTFSEVENEALTFSSRDELLAALHGAEIDCGPRGALLEVVEVVEVPS